MYDLCIEFPRNFDVVSPRNCECADEKAVDKVYCIAYIIFERVLEYVLKKYHLKVK